MFLRRPGAIGLIILLSSTYLNAFLITHHRDITKTGLYTLENTLPMTHMQGRPFTEKAMREIVNADISRDTLKCSKDPDVPCDLTTDPDSIIGTTEQLYVATFAAKQTDPPDHFDDERFKDGNDRVMMERNAAKVDLQNGDYVAARKQIGFALHTIQDFYAHSNWIDLGKDCCADRLGFDDAFSNIPIARSDEPTCPDDPSTLLTDDLVLLKARLDPRRPLTSGYFPNSRPEIRQNHKCAHGGPDNSFSATSPFRSLVDDYYTGINKDHEPIPAHLPLVPSTLLMTGMDNLRLARFQKAVTVATEHTRRFVRQVLVDGCGTNDACILGFLGYPTITSINPTSTDAGVNIVHMQVSGIGFTVEDPTTQPTVLWKGKPLITKPVASSSNVATSPNTKTLDALVDPADLTQPGTVNITVRQRDIDTSGNVGNTYIVSNPMIFTINGKEPDCPGAITPHQHDTSGYYMDVNANRWNDAHAVVQGQYLNFEVRKPGLVVWRAGGILTGTPGVAPPEGDPRVTPGNTLLWVDPQMPQVPIGALIGMIVDLKFLDNYGVPTIPLIEKPQGNTGNTGVTYFAIRNGGRIGPMPATGRLYLGINDGAFFNNGGCFQVHFTPSK
jgi:hypothetical protein